MSRTMKHVFGSCILTLVAIGLFMWLLNRHSTLLAPGDIVVIDITSKRQNTCLGIILVPGNRESFVVPVQPECKCKTEFPLTNANSTIIVSNARLTLLRLTKWTSSAPSAPHPKPAVARAAYWHLRRWKRANFGSLTLNPWLFALAVASLTPSNSGLISKDGKF